MDGCRFDACNFHFHDRLLRDNPPVPAGRSTSKGRAQSPYRYQHHLYDKNQPENLAFLRRMRALLDRFGAVGMGEVGGDDGPLELIAQYTSGGDKLHMAYSFVLLTKTFSAAHIRAQVEELERQAHSGGGWGCWAFSNHDCQRVLTRWGNGLPDPALAKVLLALLGSLRGSLCVYQGEELGLTEAEIPFERVRDPYGLAFWPEFKGRDGCRTPMPWSQAGAFAGFSQVEPWLPIPSGHQACAVDVQVASPESVLSFARQFFAWRRGQPALRLGEIAFHDALEPVLMFTRHHDDQAVLFACNLGDQPVVVTLPSAGLRPMKGHGLGGAWLEGNTLRLAPHGGFFGESD